MSFHSEFKPLTFFSGCHAQTILGSLTCFARAPFSRTEYVTLPDGDMMAIERCRPLNWRAKDPTIVLVHGLCGSHASNYLQRLSKKFHALGVQTVRVNLRGCGSGKGLARYFYHCGCSDDILACLKHIKKIDPETPISLVGFSLGGNIVLKLAGELAEAGKDILKQVIAVNAPCDLKRCVQRMRRPPNLMYERYFIGLLRADVHYRHERFGLPKVNLPATMSIYEFDEYYIAPQMGYKSAMEYYEATSSKRVVPSIAIPCQILFAGDDPIIETNCLDDLILPDNINVVKTTHGGHLGFLSSPFNRCGARWMDHFLITWINRVNPKPD